MKIQFLKKLWRQLNDDCFEGKLQEIPILITRSRSYWGKFEYHEASSRTAIYLSGAKNLTQSEWFDSLKHEMLHQYLKECLGDPKEDDHGPIFQREALRLGLRLENL